MNCPGSRCPCVDVPASQLPLGVVMMVLSVVVVFFGISYARQFKYPAETLFIFWVAMALFLYGFAFAITRLFCTT